MKNSKSTQVHAKMAHFLSIIIAVYPYEGVLDKYLSVIEQFMQQCLTDANSEARAKGRKAFLVWQTIEPQAADQLFRVLDYAV